MTISDINNKDPPTKPGMIVLFDMSVRFVIWSIVDTVGVYIVEDDDDDDISTVMWDSVVDGVIGIDVLMLLETWTWDSMMAGDANIKI